MLESVKEAFQMEKEYQDYNDLKCNVGVDGFTDFIFIVSFCHALYARYIIYGRKNKREKFPVFLLLVYKTHFTAQ